MAAAREAAIPGVLAAVEDDPETHGQLSAALAAAPVFLAGRERTKTNIIRLVNEMRVGSHALGKRMVERGYYTKPTSGSMLSNDELDQLLVDPEAWVDVDQASGRRSTSALFDLEPPFVFAGEVPPLRTWPERETEPMPVAKGTTLEGIPGCPGQATGRARVVLDPGDPTALEPGDVLIAPITDPAWTPLFVPAAAVVVDVGAQLSHAVIVSRELGIPCVVSVTGGTRLIPDGAQVTVDGTAGTVTVRLTSLTSAVSYVRYADVTRRRRRGVHSARAALRSVRTGMGPGSTPASAARWRLTKSPWMTRSRSWARAPSPSASMSTMPCTTSSMMS